MSYINTPILLQLTPDLTVRGDSRRIYLVDDLEDKRIAMSVTPKKIQDLREWALSKLEARMLAARKQAGYHRNAVSKLLDEADRLDELLTDAT